MEKSYENLEVVITGKTVYFKCGGFAYLKHLF
jgi:hypothetical protein